MHGKNAVVPHSRRGVFGGPKLHMVSIEITTTGIRAAESPDVPIVKRWILCICRVVLGDRLNRPLDWTLTGVRELRVKPNARRVLVNADRPRELQTCDWVRWPGQRDCTLLSLRKDAEGECAIIQHIRVAHQCCSSSYPSGSTHNLSPP